MLASYWPSNTNLQSTGMGITVSWATNAAVVLQACTNLTKPVWVSLQTNALTNGSTYFHDPAWTNYSMRYYQISYP